MTIYTSVIRLLRAHRHPLVWHDWMNQRDLCTNFWYSCPARVSNQSQCQPNRAYQPTWLVPAAWSLSIPVYDMLKSSLLVAAPVRRFTTSAYLRSAGNPHSKIHGLPFKLSEDKAKSLINLTAYVNEHTFASIFKILGSVSADLILMMVINCVY
jgi:hypothetical protein